MKKLIFILAAVSMTAVAVQAQWRYLGPGDLRVQALKSHDSILYAGTSNGVYRFSADAGAWTPLGLEGRDVISLHIFDADTMLAGFESGDQSIYRTTNAGASWEPFQNDYGGDEFHPAFEFAGVPGSKYELFATGISVIAKSDDAGLHWRPVWLDWNWMAMGMYFVVFDPLDPSVVWAGGEAAIFAPWLLKSIDGGENWDMLDIYGGGDNRCHDIAIHPLSGDTAWVSMEGLVRKTIDGGMTWQTVLENNYYLYEIEADPLRPNTLYCSGAQGMLQLPMFITYDGGVSWDTLYAPDLAYNGCLAMVLQAGDTVNTLFLGTHHGVYEFTDSPSECCQGRVGDANSVGGDEPTVGDVNTIVEALFLLVSPTPLTCLAEADVNQSGGAHPVFTDISIGDISVLIDYLFITGPSLGLPDCL